MISALLFWCCILLAGADNAAFWAAFWADNASCAEPASLLQVRSPCIPRISIAGAKFIQDGVEVLPLGGNYVIKAQPYYPPTEVVRANAKSMVAGVAQMQYHPSDGRKVVPVVRLSSFFQGAMPEEGVLDPHWQSGLEATLAAFAAEGVYVLLDIHQDALATTNGGEGLPWWMTAKMQETAGAVPNCSDCSSNDSYITTPDHPLSTELPEAVEKVLAQLGISLPNVIVFNTTDPWLAYSVGSQGGDPRSMNVGNINMRANNNDDAWSAGILGYTHQVQNVAWRFYRAHKYPEDKAVFFDNYMIFLRYLCTVWERFSNVIAIELLNEPPIGGLPYLVSRVAKSRSDLFDFYAAVLEELEEMGTKAVITIEDLKGDVYPLAGAKLFGAFDLEDIKAPALEKLTEWSGRGQLIYEFHWYPDSMTLDGFKQLLAEAQNFSAALGGPPIWWGEYWTKEVADTAYWLAASSELGTQATTYWQFVDSDYTEQEGWYIYPDGIPDDFCLDFGNVSEVDWDAWRTFERTVAAGTYWGACITGARGGKQNVLELVSNVSLNLT